jgi:hypothetical protein
MRKANLLKLALLSVFCLALATVNGQNTLSDEAVKVIKELKQVDTKRLSADEAQTVMKVLNQIKRENTPSAQFSAPMFYQRGEDCTTKCPREELKVVATTVSVAEKPLFILNGKEISIEEFNRLNPNCVEDLKIIKGEEAVNKYGEKAANGVLVITAKKDNAEAQREKEKVTIMTRNNIIDSQVDILKNLLNLALCLQEYVTTGTISILEYEISVTFNEFANPSFENELNTLYPVWSGGGISTRKYVDLIWGDKLSDKEKDEEIAWLDNQRDKDNLTLGDFEDEGEIGTNLPEQTKQTDFINQVE